MISNCCGAENTCVSLDGPDFEDIGICPACHDHCDFIKDPYDEIFDRSVDAMVARADPDDKKLMFTTVHEFVKDLDKNDDIDIIAARLVAGQCEIIHDPETGGFYINEDIT